MNSTYDKDVSGELSMNVFSIDAMEWLAKHGATLLLLLARFINRLDVVFDKHRKSGSFGCRQCRQVIRPRRGNLYLDVAIFVSIAVPLVCR